LRGMHGIFPRRFMLADIGLCGSIERHRSGTGGEVLRNPRIPLVNRVDPLFDEISVGPGQLARFAQGDVVHGAEAHVARFLAPEDISKDPGQPPIAGRAESNLQVKIAAVAMQAGFQPFKRSGQSADATRSHWASFERIAPKTVPMF
jgi:hypothetical protein